MTLVYCSQTVGWIKMKLGTEIGLCPGHIVLDGDTAPLPKGAQPPCLLWPTAGWIKMPLGTKVSLSRCDIELGTPFSLPKMGQCPPIFGPCLLWPDAWIDQDATWYEGRPRPRPHCARWGPSSPPPKRGHSPPIFGSCLLWPNGRPSQLLLNTC